MYSFLTRNGQTFAFGIGLLLAIGMIVSIYLGDVGAWSQIAENNLDRYETGMFNFGMKASFALMFFAALAAVGFGLYHLATNPKGALKGIIGLVAVIALYFIIYSAADPQPEMLAKMAELEFNVTPGQSKMITGAMWTALILAGASVLAVAVSELLNFFK